LGKGASSFGSILMLSSYTQLEGQNSGFSGAWEGQKKSTMVVNKGKTTLNFEYLRVNTSG